MPRFCITTTLNQLYEIYGSTYRRLTEFVFGKFNHIDSKESTEGENLWSIENRSSKRTLS